MSATLLVSLKIFAVFCCKPYLALLAFSFEVSPSMNLLFMSQARYRSWLQLTLGVAIALAAHLLLAPSVHASCGHYVVIGQQNNSQLMSQDVQAPSDRLPPAVPTVPCSGPMCSRHLPAPLLPIPPVNPDEERWSAALALFFLPEPTASALVSSEDESCPVRPSEPIFHSPR